MVSFKIRNVILLVLHLKYIHKKPLIDKKKSCSDILESATSVKLSKFWDDQLQSHLSGLILKGMYFFCLCDFMENSLLKVNLSKWYHGRTIPKRYFVMESMKYPGVWKFLQSDLSWGGSKAFGPKLLDM